jgi:hypothetical protein
MKKIVLSCLYFLVITGTAFSQLYKAPDLYKATPQTPNASSLGRFGTYQVNYNTGLADISIPVWEVSSGKISFPVKLSYHPSGVKVNDISSWVGTSWSLIAGGNITRAVVGRPDEYQDGFIHPATVLRTAASIDQTNFTDHNYLKDIEYGIKDVEPDRFSYRYPGGSGQFYYNRDKTTIINLPYDKEIIAPNLTGNILTITSKDGTLYRYGKTLGGVDCLESSFVEVGDQSGCCTFPVNWLLTAIISSDKKDTVEFKYVANTGFYTADIVHSFTLYTNHQGNSDVVFPPAGTNSLQAKNIDNSYTEQKLSEIVFRNGKIVFETVQDRTDIANEKRLSAVKVYSKDPLSGNYSLVKNVSLYHNYFAGGERLRLDSVKTIGVANENLTHKFSYNVTPLPARLSFQRDWWGYYNGAIGNVNLIPPVHIAEGTGFFDFYTGNNREVNASYTQAGILNRIDYPTGGYTEFEYEPNKYLEGVTEKLAGGVRVKQIRSFTDAGIPAFKKTLVYPYGQVNIGPGFSYLSQAQTIKRIVNVVGLDGNGLPICPPMGGPESIVLNNVSANPVISMTDYDGNSIFYNTVTEYDGDLATNNGYTEYNYNNFSDNVVNYVPPGKTFKENNLWRRSQLLSKYVKDKNGVILSSTVNTYTDVQNTLFQDVGLLVGTAFLVHSYSCVGATNTCGYANCTPYDLVPRFIITNYAIRTGLRKLLSSTEYTYDQSNTANSITRTTNYTYSASNNEPSVVSSTNSKGETISLKSMYASDYTLPTATGSNEVEGIKNLKNNNILTTPVESYQQLQASGNPLKTTAANINSFNLSSPTPTESFFLENPSPLTDFTPSSVSGTVLSKDSRYASRLKFLLFDSRNNLLQQQKTNDVISSYLWDYLSTYPVAEIQNAAYTDIAYTSFEADGKGNWSFTGIPGMDPLAVTGKKVYDPSLGALNKNISTAGSYIVSYWSKTGAKNVNGITATTGRNINGWIYYEHRLTLAVNGTVTVSGTGVIDELRLYPDNALMSTYTYNPLIGLTSQCDANNRISYYEYDALNRLVLVRDQDKNILKKICYNYAGQPEACGYYYSTSQNGAFTRNNCPAGQTGGTVIYTVPAGSYTSTVSQAAADQLAQNDVTANGQAYANANGTCTLAPCSYSMSSGYTLLTSNITNNGTTASGYFVFSSFGPMQPGTTYSVASINGGCKPSGTRTFSVVTGGRTWNVSIFPSGQMTWQMTSGTAVPANTSIAWNSFTYNL